MTSAGIARVRACFENMETVYPFGDPRNRVERNPTTPPGSLPQMPQLPQQQAPACRDLTAQEDAFEERAAIIEFDGGLPRSLAEFLAGSQRNGQ